MWSQAGCGLVVFVAVSLQAETRFFTLEHLTKPRVVSMVIKKQDESDHLQVISKLAQGKFKHVPFRPGRKALCGRSADAIATTSESAGITELPSRSRRLCKRTCTCRGRNGRQSKLTYLLTDALNGNSKTHMAARSVNMNLPGGLQDRLEGMMLLSVTRLGMLC